MRRRTVNLGSIKAYSLRAASVACAGGLLFAGSGRPVQAQGVQTVLHARRRVFPDVGRGAEAIERDAAGRYYVLAAPASIIWIYSADGNRIGQIPNAQADSAAIKYAVDFDRDAASGRIFVADRGANAVKIFTPEGALEASVPVNAPMSVVALAGGEFAVVTLRSDHLVRVMNEHGKVIRSFGNIADAVNDPSQLTAPAIGASADSSANSPGYSAGYATGPPPSYAMDIGKLYSGAPGEIYFAFTSLKDPKFRKYDRFGYAGYEAEVPANELIPDINHETSPIQVGARVAGLAGPGEAFSFGTMYTLGSVPEFTANGGHGGGGRRGGPGASGGGGAAPGGAAGSPGTASGSDTDLATAIAADSGDSSNLSGTLSASNNNSGNSATSSSSSTTDFGALLGVGGPSGGFGAPGFFGPGAFPGIGPGGFGGFGGGFEHHSFGAEAPGATDGALVAAGVAAAAPGAFVGGHAGGAPGGGPGGPESPGAGHGEYGEHFGHGFRQEGLNTFSGVVKFTERAPNTTAKPVIHALGVDRESQQVWAAIGDMLLRFDHDGNHLDTYRVATPQGAALQPVAILVEPDRILLVSDPGGVYEFARPDKPQFPAR